MTTITLDTGSGVSNLHEIERPDMFGEILTERSLTGTLTAANINALEEAAKEQWNYQGYRPFNWDQETCDQIKAIIAAINEHGSVTVTVS